MSVESGGHSPEGSEASKAFQNALDLLRNKSGEKSDDKNVSKPIGGLESTPAVVAFQESEQLAFNARLTQMIKDGDLDGVEKAIAKRNKELGKA